MQMICMKKDMNMREPVQTLSIDMIQTSSGEYKFQSDSTDVATLFCANDKNKNIKSLFIIDI